MLSVCQRITRNWLCITGCLAVSDLGDHLLNGIDYDGGLLNVDRVPAALDHGQAAVCAERRHEALRLGPVGQVLIILP
jgi:hypothetical protein